MLTDKNIFKNLFILEMANNHMGDVNHGLDIIRQMHAVCKDFGFNFAFKFQYRGLDTFIHPDFKASDLKYVKRFQETRLEPEQFKIMKDEADKLKFISVCTPFDENSVVLLQKHNFDIVKIASCSATDWPLLEAIVKLDKPVIVSTAGLGLEDIDKIVSFLEHRNKVFALMHCVAEYPASDENLQLNQIDLLKSRYPEIDIGYSTHENPSNCSAVKIAIAKGARLFEKHVGLESKLGGLNAYSADSSQIKAWLESAQKALFMCGKEGWRPEFSVSSLRGLRRGVFAKAKIISGEKIELSNTFLAIPTQVGQITANDMSKYVQFIAQTDIDINKPLLLDKLKRIDNREKIYEIVQKIKAFIKKSKILVPGELNLEISHHYGIDRFSEFGCTLINFVNREYCKKLIVLLPGQKHPEQFHKLKEETFQILYGDISLCLDGAVKPCKAGDIATVARNVKHSFSSKTGAVIEEVSSTHYSEDSFYTDEKIANNENRKTLITYWLD